MSLFLTAIVLIIATQHAFFCILEMALWTKPLGRKIFRTDPEFAQKSAVLAANQGLYNAFLAAGLVWATLYPDAEAGKHIAVFFTSCVVLAGIYGGYSVNRRIFIIQGLPALIALAALIFT